MVGPHVDSRNPMLTVCASPNRGEGASAAEKVKHPPLSEKRQLAPHWPIVLRIRVACLPCDRFGSATLTSTTKVSPSTSPPRPSIFFRRRCAGSTSCSCRRCRPRVAPRMASTRPKSTINSSPGMAAQSGFTRSSTVLITCRGRRSAVGPFGGRMLSESAVRAAAKSIPGPSTAGSTCRRISNTSWARWCNRWWWGERRPRRSARPCNALEGRGWRVLHDRRWPGSTRANIDHLVIGPPGVAVVDTKHWADRSSCAAGCSLARTTATSPSRTCCGSWPRSRNCCSTWAPHPTEPWSGCPRSMCCRCWPSPRSPGRAAPTAASAGSA